MRSAKIWHGWQKSVKPLMTGTEPYFARSSTSFCSEGADHDAVHIAGKHACGVLHRLAATDLRAFAREHNGIAAELIDAHFKRNARSGGRLLKIMARHLPFKWWCSMPCFVSYLELVGKVQNVDDLLFGEIEQF